MRKFNKITIRFIFNFGLLQYHKNLHCMVCLVNIHGNPLKIRNVNVYLTLFPTKLTELIKEDDKVNGGIQLGSLSPDSILNYNVLLSFFCSVISDGNYLPIQNLNDRKHKTVGHFCCVCVCVLQTYKLFLVAPTTHTINKTVLLGRRHVCVIKAKFTDCCFLMWFAIYRHINMFMVPVMSKLWTLKQYQTVNSCSVS